MIKDALVKSLQDEARTPRYMAGDGADWCEVNANLLTQAADTIEAQARRIEALEGALRGLVDFIGPKDMRVYASDLVVRDAAAALDPTP